MNEILEEEEWDAKRSKVGQHFITQKKLPNNVLFVPIDNFSLLFEENVIKWKFVFHRKIFAEKELSENAQMCDAIMELLSDVQLNNIIFGISPYYPKLVKKFVMKLIWSQQAI